VEVVLMVFMMIAVLNFTTHFLALRQRSMRVYVRDPEVFAVWSLILGSCLMIAAYLYWQGFYSGFAESLRFASFNVISIATSTGLMPAPTMTSGPSSRQSGCCFCVAWLPLQAPRAAG
jgi:trk system potassium uptake protein